MSWNFVRIKQENCFICRRTDILRLVDKEKQREKRISWLLMTLPLHFGLYKTRWENQCVILDGFFSLSLLSLMNINDTNQISNLHGRETTQKARKAKNLNNTHRVKEKVKRGEKKEKFEV